MFWLDFSFITPPNLLIHWDCWGMEGYAKTVCKGLWLVWHTAISVIWHARNSKIFKNVTCGVDDMVEEVKVISWKWSLTRLKISTCMFYKLCWNPKECICR